MSFRSTPLFGGALIVDLPDDLENLIDSMEQRLRNLPPNVVIDKSALDMIPDNQECFASSDDSLTIDFEINQREIAATDEDAFWTFLLDPPIDITDSGQGDDPVILPPGIRRVDSFNMRQQINNMYFDLNVQAFQELIRDASGSDRSIPTLTPAAAKLLTNTKLTPKQLDLEKRIPSPECLAELTMLLVECQANLNITAAAMQRAADARHARAKSSNDNHDLLFDDLVRPMVRDIPAYILEANALPSKDEMRRREALAGRDKNFVGRVEKMLILFRLEDEETDILVHIRVNETSDDVMKKARHMRDKILESFFIGDWSLFG